MKKQVAVKKVIKCICLLLVVGILCIAEGSEVHATSAVSSGTGSNLTGTTGSQTTLREPGTARTQDELKELNIANEFSVTYQNGEGGVASTLKILITLTAIGLAPILLLLLTSYTRIIIVLHFVRTALNTQTAPPNQILIALALFLTFFIMGPVASEINTNALQPFEAGQITQEEALEEGLKPLRQFMYNQVQEKDVQLFAEIAGTEEMNTLEDIPTSILVPSFVIGELRIAFLIGFLIYIPFIVIDMVVASTLMSMGMMMLPPTTISMPFKILLFVMADGWNLIIGQLVKTFY